MAVGKDTWVTVISDMVFFNSRRTLTSCTYAESGETQWRIKRDGALAVGNLLDALGGN
jgi:hypothetical protein